MTRINTYHPQFLSNSHLIAEYRELPRIPNRVASGKPYPNIPNSYRLGTGHESFFGDKIDWLHSRHLQILAEMQRRTLLYPNRFSGNYAIDIEETCREVQVERPDLYKWWTPCTTDMLINLERVIERMLASGKTDYFCDHKLDSPGAIWTHVVQPIGVAYCLTDELSEMFNDALAKLPQIKADADKRRAETKAKKQGEKERALQRAADNAHQEYLEGK